MSTHVLHPSITDSHLNFVILGCQRHLGSTPLVEGTGPYSLVFTPDLTPSQEDTLARIQSVLVAPLFTAPDNYEVIMSQAPTLRAYFNNPTPTNAESVAALKAVIRVLREMLRD